MSDGESSPPPPSKTKKETSPPPSSGGAAVADKTIKRKSKDRAPKDKDKKKKRSRAFGDDEPRWSRFEAVASEVSVVELLMHMNAAHGHNTKNQCVC